MKNSNQQNTAWDNLPSVTVTPQERFEAAQRDVMEATDAFCYFIQDPATDHAGAYIGLPSFERVLDQELARLSATPVGIRTINELANARQALLFAKEAV